MAKGKRTLVDLFAGCGGVGLGFHEAGFETILANEMHPDPAETYRKNLLTRNEQRMVVGSIQKVLTNKHLDQLGMKQFETDCVAGGPPCQGFSNAGPNIASDPRNQLYKSYLSFVKLVEPKIILIENVAGIASKFNSSSLITFGISFSLQFC